MKFLNLFENQYRGFIINLFLEPIRRKLDEHYEIIMSVQNDLDRRKRYGPLSPHLQTLYENLENNCIYEFLDYYIKYNTLSKDQKKIVKTIEKKQRKYLREIFNDKRPLSWSAISSFQYSPIQFADKYLLGKKTEDNAAMSFGKKIGERLSSDFTFLPEVPRLPIFEKKLIGKVDNIPLVGFLDAFQERPMAFCEYKTSSNRTRWSQKKADEHGQMMMYYLLLWLNYEIPPEQIKSWLVYIPCSEAGDFKVELSGEPVQVFPVKKSASDVLKFGKFIKEVYKEMEDYINLSTPLVVV